MKRTYTPSRKRKALKRVLVAVVLLLLVNQIMHMGLMFPRQAIHKLEERYSTGWTRTVTRDWVPEIRKTHIAYLTQNEQATLFSSAYWNLYGWNPGFGVALDCTEDAPLYVGRSSMSRNDARVWYFFGRVDDPEIKRVTVSLCAAAWDPDAQSYDYREVELLQTEGFLEQSGRRYFLLKYSDEWDYENNDWPETFVAAYDAAGTELLRMEIDHWNSSSFG